MANQENRSQTAALIRTLIEDVIAARERLEAVDTQTARRDVVRASLAAMEGEVWLAREHVRDSLRTLDELTPLADLALRETTYQVTDGGKLIEQTRSIALPTAVRLIVAQAQIICPDLAVDFAGTGWESLRSAVAIRNRITHPRPGRDLNVTNDELRIIEIGLNWLFATINYVMASTNLILVEARKFIDELLTGDPAALKEYKKALERGE